MPARRSFSAEAIAAGRALYAGGGTVKSVLAETGLTKGVLYYWLAGGPTKGPGRLAPIALRRDRPAATRRRSLRGTQTGVIERLWRTAERQVAEIEARLVEAGGDAAALERDAKTLGVLARTVRDLVALNGQGKPKAGAERPDGEQETEGENTPRDLDAFRRELAAKLAELGALEPGA